MSGLKNFISNRNGGAGSPQNGQSSVNLDRRIIAANARVQMKPHVVRPPAKGSVVGEGAAQKQSVSAPQQHSQQRPSGEDPRYSPWDTDAESIDTTINQSILEPENDRQHEQQRLQPDEEESEADGEEASEADVLEDEYGEDVTKYLAEHNLADASREDQMQFLRKTQPHIFPTVDGDSYPTTTDGYPTEHDEQQRSHDEDPSSPSLFPERLPQHSDATLSNQQSAETLAPNFVLAAPHTSNFWRQGAQIREQERNDNARGYSSREHDIAQIPAGQPYLLDQTIDERHLLAHPATPAFGVEGMVQNGQNGPSRRSNRAELRLPNNPVPQVLRPHAKPISTTHAPIVPIVEQHVQFAPVLEAQALPEGDYDPKVLAEMSYNDLKEENFDKDPRQRDPMLPKDMRGKALSERLHFVQHEFDPTKQSDFFGALSTAEWEDAGDWFLDRFSAIVKKTKEARQKKRKAAQELEQEIEGRHQQIAKKQRLVQGAMAKMQAQGENLVPKSPRASKSPRPKKI